MKYYLINNTIKKGSEMPPTTIAVNEDYAKTEALKYHYQELYSRWKKSLQPCEISESELDKITDYLNRKFGINYDEIQNGNPIDVTDIVEEKTITCDNCINLQGMFNNPDCCQKLSQKLFFKQPKQVDVEIEAVEFLEWTLSAGYKLNPHCEQNRWNHIDNINSNKPLMTDGYTTKQLYEIFKNRK